MVAGLFQDAPVDQLDRGRPMSDRDERPAHGAHERVEVGAEEEPPRRARHETERRCAHKRERPLAAAQEAREVEGRPVPDPRPAARQHVQGVAGVASHDLGARVALQYRLAVGIDDLEHLAIDPTLERGQAPLGFQRRAVERTEARQRPVREHGLDLDHMVARRAVADRIRAAGVVADHPRDHATVGGRGVGGELQPVWAQGIVAQGIVPQGIVPKGIV